MQWLAIVLIEDSGDKDGTPHDACYLRDFVESMEGDSKLKMLKYNLVPVDPAKHIVVGGPDAT